jgi:hypothetical protein
MLATELIRFIKKATCLYLAPVLLLLTPNISCAYYMDGNELYESLDAYQRVPQMMEEIEAKIYLLGAFDLREFLDRFLSKLLGGFYVAESRWEKRQAETDKDFQKIQDALDRYSQALRYIEGVHDTATGSLFSCPEDHGLEEMCAIVHQWLKENPSERDLPAARCVTKALESAWPVKDSPEASDKL